MLDYSNKIIEFTESFQSNLTIIYVFKNSLIEGTFLRQCDV